MGKQSHGARSRRKTVNPSICRTVMPNIKPGQAQPLLQSLQSPGALRKLLLQAAGEEQAAAKRLLRRPAVRRVTRRLVDDARQRVQRGTDTSPLAVLRQCGAGCSSCCWTPVIDVTPLEAIVVATYLQHSLPEERLEELREQIAANAKIRLKMTPEQQAGVRIRCALLGPDGLCSVYASRPLVCAGVFSLSRTACETASRGEDGHTDVPLDQPAKAWTMGVSGGLQRALVEAGLDGNLYELHGAVLCVLDTPAAAAKWLRGEDVFADCLCTDPHSPPRKRRRIRIDSATPLAAEPHFATDESTKKRRHRAKASE
jgi:hypothetical protein